MEQSLAEYNFVYLRKNRKAIGVRLLSQGMKVMRVCVLPASPALPNPSPRHWKSSLRSASRQSLLRKLKLSDTIGVTVEHMQRKEFKALNDRKQGV